MTFFASFPGKSLTVGRMIMSEVQAARVMTRTESQGLAIIEYRHGLIMLMHLV